MKFLSILVWFKNTQNKTTFWRHTYLIWVYIVGGKPIKLLSDNILTK